MIAFSPYPTGVREVYRGEWTVWQALDTSDLPTVTKVDLQQGPSTRKGFRSDPVNPRKRVPSKKSRKR